MRNQLKSAVETRQFALAGNATFTLQSAKTGARFTYRVRACEDKPTLFFVSLLTGSDNESNYQYLGTISPVEGVENVFRHGRKSRITEDAPGARAFAWTWRRIRAGVEQEDVEIFHEGKCGRCGRKLTVPESIQTGLGPDCAEIMGVVRTRTFECEAA